ncbi:MAG: hypothetical protein Q9159_003968 [Coniocarpon cinnabarinum]
MATEVASPILQPLPHQHQRSSTLPANDLSSGRTNSCASTSSYVKVDTPRERTPTGSSGRPSLLRSQSAYNSGEARQLPSEGKGHGGRSRSRRSTGLGKEIDWQMRHGWDLNADQLRELSSSYFYYYDQKRHETGGNPSHGQVHINTEEWRMRDRLKTVTAILALCLNIGVDPPDVIKTNPCARLECWTDPNSANHFPSNQAQRIILQMGKNLQAQYETISLRTKYRFLPDPTHEEMKKYSTTLRRAAKDERILFHYNGHGVPKPTDSGEIWVFNKSYTQYIPISLYDLQAWLGAPSLFVWDATDSGVVVQNFNKFIEKHEQDNADALRHDPHAPVQSYADCIHLAACRSGETLPINPELPADLFTSCLTTPIEMALRIFILQNPLTSEQSQEDAKAVPGKTSERRTPIGELNWIFTAITDTIAWNSLPKHLFKKLFRQDLMVAALFRNFLLAQRIMRRYGCRPQCYPDIPDCHEHPLWDSWDLAVELVLSQVPAFKLAQATNTTPEYQSSDFFADHLTAFEVYLDQGANEHQEPQQLPILLQVLLSQNHRIRALILLSRFLDLGPWAVKLALGIGIFPYVLKLLQSQANELKPVMVFIWARILAVEQSCQEDLIKDNGYQYFISILNPAHKLPVKIVGDHRMMCAFIVAMFCKDYIKGQRAALSPELVQICISQIDFAQNDHPGLRQWCCLCLSMLWKAFPEAKWVGVQNQTHVKLCKSIQDPVPEVRTAAIHALTDFLGIPDITDEVIMIEESIAANVLVMGNDGSNIVRKELVVFFSTFAARHLSKFVVSAYEEMSDEASASPSRMDSRSTSITSVSFESDEESQSFSTSSIYAAVWKLLLIMSVDPDPEVARDAQIVVDVVMQNLTRSPLGAYAQSVMTQLLDVHQDSRINPQPVSENQRPPSITSTTPLSPASEKGDGYFSLGLRRTASVAASLKSLAFGPGGTPTPSRPPSLRLSKTDLGQSFGPPTPMESQDQRLPPLSNTQDKARFPLPKYYKPRTKTRKSNLPLTSTFFDFSTEYFREPQMKGSEADEPGSVEYNTRLWRRNRNEHILETTQKLKEQAGSSRWDENSGVFDNGVQPIQLCFHQYDNHLAVTDDRDNVRVWDWKSPRLMTKFRNANPPGSRITGLRFVNEDDYAILMTGSSDGVVKLFRHYDEQENVFMTASFRALTDLVPSTHNAGLIFEWLQGRGSTLVAGDAKVIRLWSAETETCVRDIPARSGSCVTSLTSDQVEANVFVAGFGDGAVRVYDQREPNATSRVAQWKEHNQWITNVHMQRGGRRELVSGSRNGEVKLWDIRQNKSIHTMQATKDTLRSLSVHEHAPVFATGTERHSIKVHSMRGAPLSSLHPYASFMQHSRTSPISATSFHPHRMMLACAALNDTHINLFSCVDTKASFSPI